MRLRRLEIVGFKSFAAKTALEFERGLCAIVGPNGSGKSNLSDAVRWALGEQSVRALRSRRSEEVIFAGGGGRQPLGLAEVSLVLDDEGGRLGLPMAEVRITRRLYRDGTGEYLLNGTRSRLRDLQDLLARAGLGPDSYCVIGQGQVDELVLQRAEERRAHFESAAGVRGYQARLAEARSNLAATAANLTRCRDLIAELEPHVRRLRSRAEQAERRQRLEAEYSALALAWHRRSLFDARATLLEAESELARRTAEVGRLEARLADLEARRQEVERDLAEADGQLGALEEALAARARQRASLERELAVRRERAANLAAQAAQAAGEIERLTARRAELERDLAERAAAADAAAQALAAAASDERRLAEAAQGAASRLGAARADLAAARQQLASAEEALAARRAAEAQAAERRARRDRDIAAGRALLADRIEQLEQLRARLADAEQKLTEASAMADEARARWQAASEERRAAESELERCRAAEAGARGDVERLAAEQAALDQARAALVQASGPPGDARGPDDGAAPAGPVLVELLRIDPEWQRAIGVALGEAARTRLAADPAGLLARLAGDRPPRLLLADRRPLDAHEAEERLAFRATVERALAGFRWGGFAEDRVAADPAAGGALARLLGRTLIAPDLPAAVAIAERLAATGAGPGWQVATADGRLVRWDGVWAAGADAGADQALALQAALAALAPRREQAEERLRRTGQALAAAGARAEQAGRVEARLRSERDERAAAERAARLRVEELRRELRSAEGEVARRRSELERADRDDPQPSLDGRPVRELEEAAAALRQRADAAEAEVDAARSAAAAAERELSAARATRALRESELRAGRALLDRVRGELERARAALDAAERQRAERLAAAEAAAGEAAALARQAEQLADESEDERAARTLRATRRERAAELRRLETEIDGPRRALAEARAAREAALLVEQRASHDLARRIREAAEAGAELGDAAADWPVQLRLGLEEEPSVPPDWVAEPPPALDLEATRRRLGALRRELATLGEASPSVLAEYRELAERLAFLEGQSADLSQAMASLEAAIAELETIVQSRFLAAFDRINVAFDHHFRTLFGGGEARLVLTRPEDLLETGVELVARPPGKKLQSLLTLSGGERALTAVALIFALLEANPTPFCVLDEVDAALDEANVQRFLAILREFARSTQFLVITHNRATMEAAEAVYGVSMDANGVTRIISLRPAAVAQGGDRQPA